MNDAKPIVDRKATDGIWMFTPYALKVGRKVRKAHYFNAGSRMPLCSPPQFTGTKKMVTAHLPSADYTHVESAEGETRSSCGYCRSLVLHGVDLQANHARREFGQPMVTAHPDFTTPYTFGKSPVIQD
jgi:hypothetical protein